jgi:hypothetical protein
MTAVEVGEVVTLTELDSEPALFVLDVDEDITGALVADLADETIQRLEQTTGDRQGRRELAQAVANADAIMTFRVPPAEVAHRDEPGITGCEPVAGGVE